MRACVCLLLLVCQCEERDYWHATETYYQLSPFSHALKIAERQSPLLLVHGDNDPNSGGEESVQVTSNCSPLMLLD